MASEWRHVQIGDLGRVVTGRTPPGNDPAYYDGAVPFLTPSDIVGLRRVASTARSLSSYGAQQLGRCLVPRGVGVSCIGWQMGKSVLIDRPTVTNQQINSIIVNEETADCSFIYYSLLGRRDELFNLGAGGSRTPILNKGDFARIPFLLPPLAVQRAIAHILGALDDKIELNQRINETLEAIARALFKSWFVDFDPVRAKSEGRDPGLPKPLADLFPDRFEDSELGEIPARWEVRPIGDLADVVGGSTPATSRTEFWEGGRHCWATPKDLAALSSPVLVDTERRIPDAGLAQVSSGLLPAGTVLLSSRAPIGYLAVTEAPTAINQGFIAMKPKESVPNLFLLLWARFAHEEILSRANGSTFLEISKSNFRPIPVVRATDVVLDTFESLVKPLYKRVVANVCEFRTLAAMRDTLLPRLISGELRLTDRIDTSRVDEEKARKELAHAEKAPARIKEAQADRLSRYEMVFGALTAEEQALEQLYAPLRRRTGDDPRLSKLTFVVQRVVDLEAWASRGEILLDLRKPPFNRRGGLADAARASLLPAWKSGAPQQVRSAMQGFMEQHAVAALDALAQGSTPLDFGEWLFSTDHISVRYDIQYEGVEIARLSPGTRGVVLLTLYLALDEWDLRPLIIDQPEENLDPRSVYTDLVQSSATRQRRSNEQVN